MFHKLIQKAHKANTIEVANAHCDIPCGIYDTGPALIAAVSVVRMMDIISEAVDKDASMAAKHNLITRNVVTKEEEAEKVKHEIRVIWGDYFKAKHVEEYPNIHELTHSIMQKASACKQDVHREDGVALVDLINQFAEIFWATKGKETRRVVTPYAPGLEVVEPVL